MKIQHLFPKLLVLATMYSIQAPAGPPVQRPSDEDASLTFVYIHGFGGKKTSPEFCVNLGEFLSEEEVSAEVINYEWDSVKVDPLQAGASRLKAQEAADAEAPQFQREVIERLENEGNPYVLVGFSVGSRVLLKALDSCDEELKHLRGVYFLGSAMTKDMTLKKRVALPKGMRITNYHSPKRDFVHRMAFNFMSEIPPGGQVGFDDEKVFENYPVSCSHAHKGVGMATDYSGLAEAIAFMELYKEEIEIEGDTKLNWKTRVMDGDLWWNRIHERGEFVIEQHTARPGYYRALRVDGDGGRKRVARGENLHAILEALPRG